VTNLYLFVLAIVGVLATPGPTNTLLCTSGALVGTRRSLPLVIAEATGYFTAICGMRLIGSLLGTTSPSVAVVFRIVLVAYLLLLAYRLWRTKLPVVDTTVRAVSFGQVFVTTMLNPKAALFAFVIFPPFDTFSADIPYLGTFIAAVMVIGTCWIGLGAVVGTAQGGTMARFVPRAAAAALCIMATIIAGSAIAACC